MKSISLLPLFIVLSVYATAGYSATPSAYAGGITMHNIAVIQHSAMINAFDPLGLPPMDTSKSSCQNDKCWTKHSHEEPANLDMYGKMPIYGEMKYYGEYGDDGQTKKSGRSGGDTENDIQWFGNLLVGWQHFDDDVKLDNLDRFDSKYDLISMNLVGGRSQINGGVSEWGLFGGFINGKERTDSFDLSEHGGYFGLTKGYYIYGVGLSFAVNGGIMDSTNKMPVGDDDFTSKWFGGALNLTYDIALTDTLVIRPGIYGGYTWIKSDNYLSVTGDKIDNENLKMFSVAYSLRAIKHFGNNWYGILSGRYIINMEKEATTVVNNIALDELNLGKYGEYGIMVEKNIDRFNIAVSVNRRDGARRGWNGGVHLKYVF